MACAPKNFTGFCFHPAQGYEFAKCFGNFCDQRAAGHGHDNVVRQRPTQLLGDFEAVRLRAFGVVRAQIHVDQAPLKTVGDLRAETIDVVVVAVDAHDARAVNGGVQNLWRVRDRRE